MNSRAVKEKKITLVPDTVFSKEQILTSDRFQDRKDVLNVILSGDKSYTIEAVEKKIAEFMKGKVK